MTQQGECHCRHVTKLQEEVAALKTEVSHLRVSFGARPFIPSAAKEEPLLGSTGAHVADDVGANAWLRLESLPLELGPLGSLGSHGRPPFDYRIAGQSEFQFSSKGGDQWKGKTERYLMSMVPAAHAILEWAERQTEPISQKLYEQAVGEGLTTWDRDGNAVDHAPTLNSAIWGFLSNCLSGEAQTMFKKSDKMMGVDAWRRLVRFIDHGRDIRLETLRNEVRMIRGRYVIKSLEEVVVGIAKSESKIQEFVDAGGKRPDDQEMKSDLSAILPPKVSGNLLFKQTDVKMSYDGSKAFVGNQTAMTLMNSWSAPCQQCRRQRVTPMRPMQR
jgi:hypothetical protein